MITSTLKLRAQYLKFADLWYRSEALTEMINICYWASVRARFGEMLLTFFIFEATGKVHKLL